MLPVLDLDVRSRGSGGIFYKIMKRYFSERGARQPRESALDRFGFIEIVPLLLC